MRLDWDERNRRGNLAKHGADFAATETFAWSDPVVIEDSRREYGETRFQAFGPIGGRLHSLIYTRRGDSVRVISLRKANARERKRYEEIKQAQADSRGYRKP